MSISIDTAAETAKIKAENILKRLEQGTYALLTTESDVAYAHRQNQIQLEKQERFKTSQLGKLGISPFHLNLFPVPQTTKTELLNLFAEAKIPPDEKRIDAAIETAGGMKAEEALCTLETPANTFIDCADGLHESTEDYIRRRYADGRIEIDDKLNRRIEAAVTGAFGRSGIARLVELEQSNIPYIFGGDIKKQETDIRERLNRGGVKIDDKLEKRIKKAVATAYKNSATAKLTEVEERGFSSSSSDGYVANSIQEIRDQFIAGGVVASREGRLPTRIENRINAVVAKHHAVRHHGRQ